MKSKMLSYFPLAVFFTSMLLMAVTNFLHFDLFDQHGVTLGMETKSGQKETPYARYV